MLYVDGMNGVIQHNETIQWLYSLTLSKVSKLAGYIGNIHSGIRTQQTRHSKFKTRVSVTPTNGLVVHIFLIIKMIQKVYKELP